MKMRSNKINIYIPVLLLLFAATSSCKKSFLDKEPYGGLPTSDAIKTTDDMETALNGAYANLRSADLYGRTVPLFADLVADNVYISTTRSNRYLDFYGVNYAVTNLNAEGIWQAAYNTILNTNNVINCSLQGTEDIDQFRGEALAIRALMYFELVKHFSKPYTVAGPATLGVPIILTYDPFNKPQRNTLGEVYTQIQKDLTDAVPLLKKPRTSGYFTEYAAKALLARMHQFKGEWGSALSVAEDIINNSGYSLVGLNQFYAYWTSNTARNDGLETLFEVVFDLVGNIGNESLPYFYDQAGYGDALCAQSFYNTYSTTDFRRGLILTFSPVRGNVKVVNKYPNISQPDKDDFKVLRLSEVYLIAAEAAFQGGDETTALTYLNEIAFRRDPDFAGYNSSGADLLDDILSERRKELAFEGHRYWDLARYNRDVIRINLAGNYQSVPLTVPADNYRRILPIPQSELDANPNIRTQQNTGYN